MALLTHAGVVKGWTAADLARGPVYEESTKGGGESRFAKFVSRNG